MQATQTEQVNPPWFIEQVDIQIHNVTLQARDTEYLNLRAGHFHTTTWYFTIKFLSYNPATGKRGLNNYLQRKLY